MKFFITFVNVLKGHSFQCFYVPELQALKIDYLFVRLIYENTILFTFQDFFWPIIVD